MIAGIFARWAALAAIVAAAAFAGWVKGAASVKSDWDEANAVALARVDAIRVVQGEITKQVVTEYRDRIKVIRETGQTIIKEVPIYVPVDSCQLPGGFRVLHDAAARGELPDPSAGANAAPVPASDVAVTTSTNYTGCRETIEQLNKFQQWAAGVAAATEL